MKAWQEEQIQSLLTCDNAPELFQRVTQLAQEIGFDYCAYGIRMPIPISAPRTEMFSNYPAAWLALYQAQNYLMTDPSITQATRTSMPFVWTEARALCGKTHARMGWNMAGCNHVAIHKVREGC